MSAIAFLPDQSYGQVEWVDRTTRMAVFFVLLVLYNVMRGFSVCGVLPWFTHIIPESRRGEFLAKDQFAAAVGTILSTIGYAAMLTGRGNWYAFGSLFTISAIAAFHSLSYLHRIPDVPVHAVPVNNEARPWAEMLFYPPFLRYIIYNMVINFACGAAGVFWVPFFRDALGVTESGVMLSACFTSVVLAASLYFFGSQIDRVGNKPILILSALVLILHFAGWAAIGAHLVRFNTLTLAWQCMTSGIGGALWNLANVRMVIGIIPVMGRAHFLALYSVIFNVTFGLAPLLLAPAMDHLDKIHWNCTIGLWTWNSYSLLYTLLSAIIGLGLALLLRIPEPGSMSWEEFTRELFVKTPSRGISRLIGRWRGTGV
jgi:MFS family permease